tara:strand:+ start:872 stop:1297 length:426 start_codon:yes stop_codon:yes gene_type:complete
MFKESPKEKKALQKINANFKAKNKTVGKNTAARMRLYGMTPYVATSDKSEDNKPKDNKSNDEPIEIDEIVVTASKPKSRFKRTMSGFKPEKEKNKSNGKSLKTLLAENKDKDLIAAAGKTLLSKLKKGRKMKRTMSGFRTR